LHWWLWLQLAERTRGCLRAAASLLAVWPVAPARLPLAASCLRSPVPLALWHSEFLVAWLAAAGCWLLVGCWLLAAGCPGCKEKARPGRKWMLLEARSKKRVLAGHKANSLMLYSLLRVVSQLSAVSQVLILTQAASSD